MGRIDRKGNHYEPTASLQRLWPGGEPIGENLSPLRVSGPTPIRLVVGRVLRCRDRRSLFHRDSLITDADLNTATIGVPPLREE